MEQILQYLPNFLLIFCRITAFFVTAPIFNSKNIPTQFKIGLSFFITMIIFSILGLTHPVSFDSLYIVAIFREIFIGLTIGFIAYLYLTAIQMAGTFADMQIGFGLANIIDPMNGFQSPILGNFKYILAVLLFFAMNGHHFIIDGIVQSYHWIPLSGNVIASKFQDGSLTMFVVRSFTEVFSVAIQLSAPIVVSLFLTDVGLGILAKTAPQLNIFVVGIPIKLLVGLVMLMLLIPGLLHLDLGLFQKMFARIDQMFAIFT
ncbi:MAG: flagellar biosynthetic protein FliR [Paenibacillus sp. RIFOXYA1_FULL_44_5]|nr:MAG: flagellar biosynthetic protein FliR [Paenibacillus sp. RIFOXYA1_FULL_44_5]